MIIGATDQEIAHAGCAHFGKGDILSAWVILRTGLARSELNW